jgi:hypothetical protein
MEYSDFMAPVVRINKYILKQMAYSNDGIWNTELVEKAIKEKSSQSGESGFSQSSIEERRSRAKYNTIKEDEHELILFSGRFSREITETPEFAEMWQSFNRTDDPNLTDVTVGILDRKYLVRFHPTPYGTWKHYYDVSHYIEFELESLSYGVHSFGGALQKDINRVMRYSNDVGKFALFSMMLAGRGSGLKPGNMSIFPFAVIPADDITQIQQLRPDIAGASVGIELLKQMVEDFRGVTHATSNLQALVTGATATEASLAQEQGMRSLSIIAECVGDSTIRPYFATVIRNLIDQNPYDSNFIPVEVIPKITSDKDYRPEHAKKLLEFANLITSIRNTVPLDFNVMPILEYLARSVGINPRELTRPKPQADRMLDILRRIGSNGVGGGAGGQGNELAGEAAGSGVPDGNVTQPAGLVPNSPIGVV